MNSLETIKQELINQKQTLQSKGISVSVQNTNPSPTEITSALANVPNLTLATAQEEDVALGKTFYAQNGELKTGSMDIEDMQFYYNFGKISLLGKGSSPIFLPTDSSITEIKAFAYHCEDYDNISFYSTNLTIPSNITKLGSDVFNSADISGSVTIPATCTSIETRAFYKCTQITDVHISAPLSTDSTFMFAYCSNLATVELSEGVKVVPQACFADCLEITEMLIPSTVIEVGMQFLRNNLTVDYLRFLPTTPPKFGSTTFASIGTTLIIIPYTSYTAYQNATNFNRYNAPVAGAGDFEAGDTLPTTFEDYTLTWYASREDAKSQTNPCTTCTTTSTYFAIFT